MTEPIIIGNVVIKQVKTGVRIEAGESDGRRWVDVSEGDRLAMAIAILSGPDVTVDWAQQSGRWIEGGSTIPDSPSLPAVAERLASSPEMVAVCLTREQWEHVLDHILESGYLTSGSLIDAIREQIGGNDADAG